jgi:lysozyme
METPRKIIKVWQIVALTAGALFIVLGVYHAVQWGTMHLSYPSPRDYPVQGIDVSHHQGPIDWDHVRRQGIRFAFVLATDGNDKQDPNFETNWREARLAGMRVGAYHFFSFCADAVLQARNFTATVSNSKASLPPVVDVEFAGNCAERPSREALAADLGRFRDEVWLAYGREPILYATEEAYAAYFSPNAWKGDLWIRNIFGKPTHQDWTFWQFANRGQVLGIGGPVDLSAFHGDTAEWDSFVLKSQPREQ